MIESVCQCSQQQTFGGIAESAWQGVVYLACQPLQLLQGLTPAYSCFSIMKLLAGCLAGLSCSASIVLRFQIDAF